MADEQTPYDPTLSAQHDEDSDKPPHPPKPPKPPKPPHPPGPPTPPEPPEERPVGQQTLV
jgi:hypothetical protein